MTNTVTNLSHMFMEGTLSKVMEQTPPQGVEVGAYIKLHYQFCMMFLQTNQEAHIPNS